MSIISISAEDANRIFGEVIPTKGKWYEIDTAPKNCQILVYGIWEDELGQEDKNPSIHVAEYVNGYWHVTGSSEYVAFVNATHWMALPTPPC